MPDKKAEDVVILGGGVIGFTTAYHLAKEGISSLVIEEDSIAAKASGNSGGHMGDAQGAFMYAVSSSYAKSGSRLMVPMADESFSIMRQLDQELKEVSGGMDIQFGIYKSMECALTDEGEKELLSLVSAARNEGFDCKWILGDEARAFESTLTTEVRGAILKESPQVEPYRYTLALAQAAENLKAKIQYAKAVGFVNKKNRVTSVILSTGREVPAEKVVIAMGPWSGQAFSWLGLKLQLTTCRATFLKMTAPKQPRLRINLVPPRPSADSEWPHLYATISPRVDGSLFVGYTEDRTEGWDDENPETWKDVSSVEMRDLIIEHILQLCPSMEDAELHEQRSGVLGFPPRGWITVGSIPKWENVYTAIVGDGGFAQSPAVGRIMTDLIVGGDRAKKTAEDIESISPDKFIEKA